MKAIKKIGLFSLLMIFSLSMWAQPQKDDEKTMRKSPAQAKFMKMKQQNFKGRQNADQERGLNLTDEQKEMMKQSRMETHKKIKPLANKLGELKAKQKSLVDTEKPDMKAINANIDKMKDVEAEIAKIKVESLVKMKSILTEEQQMKMEQMKNMRNHRGDRNQRPQRGARR